MAHALSAAAAKKRLRQHADDGRAVAFQRFFKTGPGDYAAGDRFIGVTVPAVRAIAREFRGAALDVVAPLLRSSIHEERLLALVLLVDAFKAADDRARRQLYRFYLAHTAFVNNWDLVDCSAAAIVGGWLEHRSRTPLMKLARSKVLWERRIAIIATLHFIRRRDFDETFRIADTLLGDTHDLIHKAVGWMLREVGNRDPQAEREFLAIRYRRMPRTMLRYAIEKFPEDERQRYRRGEI